MVDIIVIGGGPAGLTAALYAARAGKTVQVIEREATGGQIALSPLVENYPAIPAMAGADFAFQLTEQVEKLGVEIIYGEATAVEPVLMGFAVTVDGEAKAARAVVLATGAAHRHLGLEGEEDLVGMGVSYCAVCDGAFFSGRDVAVVGGGNSALEEALYLARIVNKVYLVHRREGFRGAQIYLDKIRASENIELVTSSVIDEIRGGAAGMSSAAVRNVQTGETRVIEAEGIFVYVGMAPVSGFLPEAVTRDAAGFIVTDAEMCTSVPGIFAAGDIRAKRCRQVSSAVGDGATAATAALSYLEHLNA